MIRHKTFRDKHLVQDTFRPTGTWSWLKWTQHVKGFRLIYLVFRSYTFKNLSLYYTQTSGTYLYVRYKYRPKKEGTHFRADFRQTGLKYANVTYILYIYIIYTRSTYKTKCIRRGAKLKYRGQTDLLLLGTSSTPAKGWYRTRETALTPTTVRPYASKRNGFDVEITLS